MGSAKALYTPLVTFVVGNDDGSETTYKPGDIVREGDAALKGREDLFTRLAETPQDVSDPRDAEFKQEPVGEHVEPDEAPGGDPVQVEVEPPVKEAPAEEQSKSAKKPAAKKAPAKKVAAKTTTAKA